MPDPLPIYTTFSEFIDLVLGYAILLAATGTVSMALVEATKGVLKLKYHYHRNAIRNWIRKTLPHSENYDSTILDEAIQEFEFLCSGVAESDEKKSKNYVFGLYEREAFYSLKTEQLIAKVQKSLEVVVQHKGQANSLYQLVLSQNSTSGRIWDNYINLLQQGADTTEATRIEAKFHYDLLIELLNCKLDTLQISLIYSWGRSNRFFSILLGSFILWFVLNSHDPTNQYNTVLSLLGGIVAPVSKNIVTAIKDFDRP